MRALNMGGAVYIKLKLEIEKTAKFQNGNWESRKKTLQKQNLKPEKPIFVFQSTAQKPIHLSDCIK